MKITISEWKMEYLFSTPYPTDAYYTKIADQLAVRLRLHPASKEV